MNGCKGESLLVDFWNRCIVVVVNARVLCHFAALFRLSLPLLVVLCHPYAYLFLPLCGNKKNKPKTKPTNKPTNSGSSARALICWSSKTTTVTTPATSQTPTTRRQTCAMRCSWRSWLANSCSSSSGVGGPNLASAIFIVYDLFLLLLCADTQNFQA